VFFASFTFESIGKSSLLIERWMLEASLPRLSVQNSSFNVKAAKSFFNVPRKKLSARPLAAEAEQSRGR
jgi:hypothetical protein